MTEPFVSRAFRGRRQPEATARKLPPGQYETRDFPVLSAGPTPHTSLATWDFTVPGPDGPAARWTWEEFQALRRETVTTDVHCVTKWSKLDTVWLAVSDGGYTARRPRLMDRDGPGFWESLGYRNYGDPWREQRYGGDR